MKRFLAFVGVCFFWVSPLYAGEVVIHLPDEKIKEYLLEICRWNGCPDAGENEMAACAADRLVSNISMGRYKNLSAIGGIVEIRYSKLEKVE